MTRLVRLLISGFNPEPWTVPTAAVGRRKGGGMYPYMVKDQRLKDYQDGIAESIQAALPDLEMLPDDQQLVLEMYFWRQLESYKSASGRRTKRHVADATNCGKALEDALQGVVFKNDSQVAASLAFMVEQTDDTTPLILVNVRLLDQYDRMRLHLTEWRNISNAMKNYEHPNPPGNVAAYVT